MAAAAPRRVLLPGEMKAREFLFFVEEQALKRVPAALRPPVRNVMWTTLQLHYGDPKLHFELQPQPSRKVVEVGLHFESEPERNDALLTDVAQRPGVQGALGEGWEIEEWTLSWRRLHLSIPAPLLTRDLADTTAESFACLITTTGEWLREVSR